MKIESFAPLDPVLYREIVRRALSEDLRGGDVTTEATVSAKQRASGEIQIKAACVLAGLDVAVEVFLQLDPDTEIERLRQDGDLCRPGDLVARVSGFAAALLTAERTALNFLQRLSGIATLARRYVKAAGGLVTILDTRKTTPMLRVLEKYAVRTGGAANHRLALGDGVLIKDNHIRLAGSVTKAVKRVRAAGHDMSIEVEAQSLTDVTEALDAGVSIVLVDNFSLEDVREAVKWCRGRAKVEISGRVTLNRVAALAAAGADYISVGALTHSAPAVDMSFELKPQDMNH